MLSSTFPLQQSVDLLYSRWPKSTAESAFYFYPFPASQNVSICHSPPPPTSSFGSSSSVILCVQLIPPYIHHGDHRFKFQCGQHMIVAIKAFVFLGKLSQYLCFWYIHPTVCRVLCVWIYFTASFSSVFYLFSAKTLLYPHRYQSLVLKFKGSSWLTGDICGFWKWCKWSLSGPETDVKITSHSSKMLTYIIGLSELTSVFHS